MAFLLLAAFSLAGCDEVTRWEARGSWSGRLSLPGEVETSSEGSVDAGEDGRSETRIRMCDLHAATFGFPFMAAVRGEPAAVRVRTREPLCRTGRNTVEGGSVLVWTSQGQDTLTLHAAPSDRWDVIAEVEVLQYRDFGLPDLDAGESAVTDAVSGTLSLTAVDESGHVILLEEGTFELTVTARRVKLSIS